MVRVRIALMMCLTLVLFTVAPHQAAAAAPEPTPPDQIDTCVGHQQLHPILDKLGRGVSNALFGWLEIPATMGQRFDERNTGGSLVAGFAYGIVRGLIRTGVGVYETVTFPMPIPEHYAPILPTLAYFDKERKGRPLPRE
jgi:putative exosortase-associated protein (TIGR04073 family)